MSDPAYTLYFAPGAASLAVHWLLLELGVPFDAVRLDLEAGEHKQPAYLAINPQGLVPTLLIDGKPQSEAAALLLLLADRHAGWAPAIDSPDRADYLQWTLHLANTLQPAFRIWFYAHEAAGPEQADAAKARARERIEACWGRLSAWLEGRTAMLGDAVSALDFYVTMLMRWSRNMPRPATDWPVLAAYVKRMKARPTFAQIYEREGLSEWP